MLVVLGILIALLFGTVRIDNPSVTSQIMSSQLAFGLMVMSFSFRLFSFDALVRERECNSGVEIPSMFIGKILGSSTDIMFIPLAYCVGNYPFIQSLALFQEFWGLYVMLALAISGLANFLAVTFTGKNRILISSGTIVILWCFGGNALFFSKCNFGFIIITFLIFS